MFYDVEPDKYGYSPSRVVEYALSSGQLPLLRLLLTVNPELSKEWHELISQHAVKHLVHEAKNAVSCLYGRLQDTFRDFYEERRRVAMSAFSEQEFAPLNSAIQRAVEEVINLSTDLLLQHLANSDTYAIATSRDKVHFTRTPRGQLTSISVDVLTTQFHMYLRQELAALSAIVIKTKAEFDKIKGWLDKHEEISIYYDDSNILSDRLKIIQERVNFAIEKKIATGLALLEQNELCLDFLTLHTSQPLDSIDSSRHVEICQEIITTLCQEEWPVDAIDGEGRSILHRAVNQSQLNFAHYLISCGANVQLSDDHGLSPMTDVDGQGYTLLQQAVHSGEHVALCCYLIQQGNQLKISRGNGAIECINDTDKDSNTLLHQLFMTANKIRTKIKAQSNTTNYAIIRTLHLMTESMEVVSNDDTDISAFAAFVFNQMGNPTIFEALGIMRSQITSVFSSLPAERVPEAAVFLSNEICQAILSGKWYVQDAKINELYEKIREIEKILQEVSGKIASEEAIQFELELEAIDFSGKHAQLQVYMTALNDACKDAEVYSAYINALNADLSIGCQSLLFAMREVNVSRPIYFWEREPSDPEAPNQHLKLRQSHQLQPHLPSETKAPTLHILHNDKFDIEAILSPHIKNPVLDAAASLSGDMSEEPSNESRNSISSPQANPQASSATIVETSDPHVTEQEKKDRSYLSLLYSCASRLIVANADIQVPNKLGETAWDVLSKYTFEANEQDIVQRMHLALIEVALSHVAAANDEKSKAVNVAPALSARPSQRTLLLASTPNGQAKDLGHPLSPFQDDVLRCLSRAFSQSTNGVLSLPPLGRWHEFMLRLTGRAAYANTQRTRLEGLANNLKRTVTACHLGFDDNTARDVISSEIPALLSALQQKIYTEKHVTEALNGLVTNAHKATTQHGYAWSIVEKKQSAIMASDFKTQNEISNLYKANIALCLQSHKHSREKAEEKSKQDADAKWRSSLAILERRWSERCKDMDSHLSLIEKGNFSLLKERAGEIWKQMCVEQKAEEAKVVDGQRELEPTNRIEARERELAVLWRDRESHFSSMQVKLEFRIRDAERDMLKREQELELKQRDAALDTFKREQELERARAKAEQELELKQRDAALDTFKREQELERARAKEEQELERARAKEAYDSLQSQFNALSQLVRGFMEGAKISEGAVSNSGHGFFVPAAAVPSETTATATINDTSTITSEQRVVEYQ